MPASFKMLVGHGIAADKTKLTGVAAKPGVWSAERVVTVSELIWQS